MKRNDIDQLLLWYHANRRDLPWRNTQDPYAIWLSEIMLQQTQVDTVIPYYERFLSYYPTVQHLAAADPEQVLKLWEGLGYYSRAKRLIPCAKMVVDKFNARFPNTKEQMLTLPGVGPYTAGAVLGIAFNVKEPAVDGNVLRVMTRYLAWDIDIAEPKSRVAIEKHLSNHLPDDMRGFAQALMELGATICTPKSPKCSACPVQSGCTALYEGRVGELPVKQKKKASPTLQVAVALIECEGQYLMYQKEESGLLGGFWAYPYATSETEQDALSNLNEWLTEYLGSWWMPSTQLVALDVKAVKHVFTHQIWQMKPYCATIESTTRNCLNLEYPIVKWVDAETMEQLAITTAMRKIAKII